MLSDALHHARRTIKPGSELFVISDFQNFDEASSAHLFRLSRHNDVVCVMVFDRLETELPPPGFYTITDGVERSTLDLSSAQLREHYHNAFEQRLSHLQSPHLENHKRHEKKFRARQFCCAIIVHG